MVLLILLALLVAPLVLMTAAGALAPSLGTTLTVRMRAGLSLLLVFTGVSHFTRAEEMAGMLPPTIHYREGIILATGVIELLAATGLWVPGLARVTGACLIAFLVCVLPANVYASWNDLPFGGGGGPAYLMVRIPFQILLIAWTWRATLSRSGLA